MDFETLLARVKGILLQPTREWPRIAGEAETPAGLYKRYILVLAALPPVFGFIKYSLIGQHTLGVYLRGSILGGLWSMLLGYLVSLVTVYIMAHIVNTLAPTFEGRKNLMQALKVTAYAWTAAWVAGIAVVVPWVGWLIGLAGVAYSIYLLYLGLPQTMQCPREKSLGYTTISALLAFLLGWLLAALLGTLTGVGTLAYRLHHEGARPASHETTAATAGPHAHHPGPATDASSSKPAAAALAGTQTIQSLGPERMRAMLPQKLDGYTRESARASRQDVLNAQLSQAEATYRDGNGNRIDLSIIDTAGVRTLLGMAGTPAGDVESVTDNGFDKMFHRGDRVIHETWDSKARTGQYSVVVARRYVVRAQGTVPQFADLENAVEAVDLAALEKLQGAGMSRR